MFYITNDNATHMEMVFAVLNVFLSFVAFLDLCSLQMVAQVMGKVTAAISATEDFYTIFFNPNASLADKIFAGISLAVDIIIMMMACFTADTPVAVENGFKRIDEIEVGDMVWAYHVETGELELKEVLEVFVKEVKEILHLETTVCNIETTTNHPFYVIGLGWVAAGDLRIGDTLLLLDGGTAEVTAAELEKLDTPVLVYNFEVADFNSYFVGSGVLVHNDCPKLKAKLSELIKKIPEENKKRFQCLQFADDLEELMSNNGIKGQRVRVTNEYGFVYSTESGKIGELGFHDAIRINDTIYDNMNPTGVNINAWLVDLGLETSGGSQFPGLRFFKRWDIE